MADNKSFDCDSIRVSLPLSDVFALYDMVKDYPVLQSRLISLESEVDALRSTQSRMMIILGDIKRGI